MKNQNGIKIATFVMTAVFVLVFSGNLQACPGDINGDGNIGFSDLTSILAGWGPCEGACPGDLNGDGNIGFSDLTSVLAGWGPCPSDECVYDCLAEPIFCVFEGGTLHDTLECSGGGHCCELPTAETCPFTCETNPFVCMENGGTAHSGYDCDGCCQY